MNLDELISKYLDGELSVEEDEILRGMISDDHSARRTYDSDLSIHMALREDAESIEMPEELARKTESEILMRIIADSMPAPLAVVESKVKGRIGYLKYASVAAVLLIAGYFSLNEYKLRDINLNPGTNYAVIQRDYFIDNNNHQIPLGDNIVTIKMPRERFKPVSAGDFAVERSEEISVRNDMPSDVIPPTVGNIQIEQVPSTNVIAGSTNSSVADDHGTAIRSLTRENVNYRAYSFGLSDAPSYESKSTGLHLPSIMNSRYPGVYYGQDNDNYAPPVRINSLITTEFSRGGLDKAFDKSVNSYSQSVSFWTGSFGFIGIELGYSQYRFENIVKATASTSQSAGASSESLDNPTHIEVPTRYQVVPGNMKVNKQIVTLSAFCQKDLITIGDLSLNSTLGLGFSSDGPMGYTRLTADYEIYNGVALTFGVDAKVFRASLPDFAKTGSDYKTSLGAVYGLRIIF